MKFLITGGGGFIGSNIIDYFRGIYNIRNIPSNLTTCSFYITNDPRSTDKYDCLILCGWRGASNSKDLDSMEQMYNISDSIKLLDFAIRTGITKVIFISTSWVYGDFSKTRREVDQCEPVNLYGYSKLKTEEILQELCDKFGIKLLILRPLWLYGPGDKENRFIPTIIRKCLNNEDIELNPCIHEVNYLNIIDFCNAIDILINKQVDGIYNICNDNVYKIKDIVEGIKSLINSNSKITYNKEYPPDYIKFWSGSCGKLKKLGWFPRISITEGLKNTINATK